MRENQTPDLIAKIFVLSFGFLSGCFMTSLKITDKLEIFNLIPAFITGSFQILIAYITYREITKKLDEKKEVVDFHKKYIDIKNEISRLMFDIKIQNSHDEKLINIKQLALLFSRKINLLFEESLSAAYGNQQVHEKLFRDLGWLNSTSIELKKIEKSFLDFFPEYKASFKLAINNNNYKDLDQAIMEKFFKDKNYLNEEDKNSNSALEKFFLVRSEKLNSFRIEVDKKRFATDVSELLDLYHERFAEIYKSVADSNKDSKSKKSENNKEAA